MHDNSTLHKKSNQIFCMFKAFDSIKKLLKNLGLSEELKKEYDGYVFRFLTYHAHRASSIQRLKEVCNKKFSPELNRLINDRLDTNSKLMPIIDMLLASKIKLNKYKI